MAEAPAPGIEKTPQKEGPVLVDYGKASSTKTPEVHVEAAIETAAKVQKASILRDRLFPSLSTLGERLAKQATDTLKTTATQYIMGMVSTVLNETLFGGKAHIPMSGPGGVVTHTNYGAFSQPGRMVQQQGVPQIAPMVQFQGFEFGSDEDAQAVLRGMDDALNANQVVTVANYKELCGMANMIDNTDYRKGWTDLSRVPIKRTWGSNTWYLALPNPINLYQ
jgi:hypothetical protein